MYTYQLKRALKNHPKTRSVYGGVFARDKLPVKPPTKETSYIVNTHPSSKPGQHWVAFFITEDTVYFFDSYGIPPVGFERVIKWRKNYVYNRKRLQGIGRMCGHYCLYFILAMQTHHTFRIFSDDYNTNDRVVKRFVEKRFDVRRANER